MITPAPLPKPLVWRQRLLQLFTTMAVVLICVLIVALLLIASDKPLATANSVDFILMFIVFVVMLLFSILLHELGHLLGGRLVGFHFVLLIVGPFKVQRVGRQLHFGWNRHLHLAIGLAGSLPKDHRHLRRRMLLMVAGGPAISLLFAGLALYFLLYVEPWLQGMMALFGAMNSAISLLTLLPISTGLPSDGSRLLLLLRGRPAAARWCAALALSYIACNQRPRTWDRTLLAAALAVPDGSLDDVSSHFLAYSADLDRGDSAAAAHHLAYALTNRQAYPAALQPALFLEAAYLAAQQGDAPAARIWLDQAAGAAFIEPHIRARVAAAVLLAEGRHREAATASQAGLTSLAHHYYGPEADHERDMLHALVKAAGSTSQG